VWHYPVLEYWQSETSYEIRLPLYDFNYFDH